MSSLKSDDPWQAGEKSRPPSRDRQEGQEKNHGLGFLGLGFYHGLGFLGLGFYH